MAHPNIDQRRHYVKILLDKGVYIDFKMKLEIGIIFACSHSAITADILALTRNPNLPTPHVSQNMRKKIRQRDGILCQYCGSKSLHKEYVVEHVIPASIGGVAKPYNLVIACQSCNSIKGKSVWIPNNIEAITKDYSEWRIYIMELATNYQ
ncbi:MAG: HNH endonuclease [Nostoc sp. DedVER02]|uniref:HNH endonuclease n=1 Tax=unclassified Nostoc TaxID=2593658 RepID=UPI002AD4F056|nr:MULTISPECIES: HNH endonuclease [unclassified Nostoc]MDZ7988594.1 HNH endonuclease [Nostoc sp. DedVER02]MDZ8112222.1 HNH endonuclease [Nostoc sp. DedVER01b]